MSYNGYENYPTWNVALWLDNEQGTSDFLFDIANQKRGIYERSMELQERVEAWIPDLGASLASDLLGYALAEVNWREIIESHEEHND